MPTSVYILVGIFVLYVIYKIKKRFEIEKSNLGSIMEKELMRQKQREIFKEYTDVFCMFSNNLDRIIFEEKIKKESAFQKKVDLFAELYFFYALKYPELKKDTAMLTFLLSFSLNEKIKNKAMSFLFLDAEEQNNKVGFL